MAAADSSPKIVLAAGEGSGKSYWAGVVATAHSVHDLAMNGTKPDGSAVSDLYWFIGIDYTDAYKDFSDCLEMQRKLENVDETTVHIRDEGRDKCSFRTLSGQLFETITGDDPSSIGRLEPQGIIGAEVSRWKDEIWTRSFGRLARNYENGSWGIFSGSFETNIGAFADYYAYGQGPNELGLRSFNMPTWTNYYKYPGGYDNPEIQRQKSILSEHKFLERFGGRPAPPGNAVIQNFSTALHVDMNVKYLDGESTYITVDPGDLTYAVLIFQVVGSEIWIQDEGYFSHWNHESVIDEMKLREGWKYAARTRRGIIDIAGTQHHASASPMEIWEDRTGFSFEANKIEVDQSVERLQSVLTISPTTGRSRLRIHPRCTGLISELGGGPSPVEGGGVWVRAGKSGRPERKNDHSCKALAYALVALFGTSMPDGMYLPENLNMDSIPSGYLEWSVG